MPDLLTTLADFFLDWQYLNIMKVTAIVFAGMAILWFSYKHLSKRDLFTISKKKNHEISFWSRFSYWLKYIFIFPLWIFFWFAMFVLCLKILSYKSDFNGIMFLGIVIVSSIRVSAYFSEQMAEDLAKMLPLTLLAALILNPSFITINIKAEDFYIFRDGFMSFAKYLLFIIVLEFMLRMGKKAHDHYRKEADKPADLKQDIEAD
jgi:hypothetical protein